MVTVAHLAVGLLPIYFRMFGAFSHMQKPCSGPAPGTKGSRDPMSGHPSSWTKGCTHQACQYFCEPPNEALFQHHPQSLLVESLGKVSTKSGRTMSGYGWKGGECGVIGPHI